MFKRVRVAVEEETGGIQTPWEASSLQGDFAFLPTVGVRPTPAGDKGPAPQEQTSTPVTNTSSRKIGAILNSRYVIRDSMASVPRSIARDKPPVCRSR